MKDTPEPTAMKALPLDAMAEDIFGLNLRGLKSVRVLWVNPQRYYAAARTLDWDGVFTPSIRLWLSFFALFSFLKVWWIGGNDGMTSAYAAGFAEAGLVLPPGKTYADIGRESALWAFSLVPIIQIISMVILSLVYPFWGGRTTIAQRQRYFFATVVPAASLMPIFMTAMMVVPSAWLTAYGLGLAAGVFLVDFQTAYRGAYGEMSRWAKAWRAALLAGIIVSLNVLTSIGAQIAGIMVTAQKYTGGPIG